MSKIKKKWNAPVINTILPINETLGNVNQTVGDSATGGQGALDFNS